MIVISETKAAAAQEEQEPQSDSHDLHDPNAKETLFLQEGDQAEKVKIMERFLAFWLARLLDGSQGDVEG